MDTIEPFVRTIHFNTRRLYTQHGQRVTATYRDEDGSVTFWDHDRTIDGEFKLADVLFFNQGSVMSEYDGLRYQSTTRSRQDGMYKGGLNVDYKGPSLKREA